MPKETPIMELITQFNHFADTAMNSDKRVAYEKCIDMCKHLLPAEREMIEEACIGFAKWIQNGTYARYESGVWHPFDTDQQPDTFTDAELYEYYLQTFKSNGDEK